MFCLKATDMRKHVHIAWTLTIKQLESQDMG